VSDATPDVLKYASRLGIGLRTRINVKERIDFDSSLRVEIDGREQFISSKLAQNIFVEQVS
jgi:DtxR family Mn-dependent transcriptional regulator